jgi:hypothetical protein
MNLKLDIEDKLWGYFENDRTIQVLFKLNNHISAKIRAESALLACQEIKDRLHPITNLCFDLAEKHKVPIKIKVFEGDLGNADKVIGCISGPDYIYLHYLQRTQDSSLTNYGNLQFLLFKEDLQHCF